MATILLLLLIPSIMRVLIKVFVTVEKFNSYATAVRKLDMKRE